ncbi:MAG: DNA topoisomerase IV subunit B, partial [Gammaproteobacteria bacterium]|nr:DNA topoisomerase IV subunit B [Gammaproteobacteria bacterium]
MASNYNAKDIEVLNGLDPVRRRPGMYTDTARPNHLAQEVIDNSVDEAIIGCATCIKITLHKDGSLEVEDDGRGMPVDKHPGEKISGIELIMTRLHAGGKFSDKNYQFSGGLHGVGVSVVNALSSLLEVEVKRDGNIYAMSFQDGEKKSKLEIIGSVPKRETGTKIHFWPNAKYFEAVKFSVPRLIHVMRAKAVLCSGLRVIFDNLQDGSHDEWCYNDGLSDYLLSSLTDIERVPLEPFTGS